MTQPDHNQSCRLGDDGYGVVSSDDWYWELQDAKYERERFMELTASGGGPPAGSYRATFLGAFDLRDGDYGKPIVTLRFQILGGIHDQAEATRICTASLTPRSALMKFAVALKNSPVEPNERFNFDNYRGAIGNVLVTETEGGFTRVESFYPEPPAAPQQQAPPQQAAPLQPQQAPIQQPQQPPQQQAPPPQKPQQQHLSNYPDPDTPF